MKKEVDIYISFLKSDESLARSIKDSILSYNRDLNIHLGELEKSNEEIMSNSEVYMPIITNSFFELENARMFKDEMKIYSDLEEKGEMKIEAISFSFDILFNDLRKLDTEANKILFEITRGLSFIFVREDTIGEVMESVMFFIEEDFKIEEDVDYKYDVFLSWTWNDRDVKNKIKEHFKAQGLKVYDSEKECHNKFTSNFLGALLKSKTYVLLLSDSLSREDLISDVRREIQTATDLEKKLRLNIEILVLSESYLNFGFGSHSNVSKFFYDTTGFDRIDCTKGINEKALNDLDYKIFNYLDNRNNNTPIFYSPDFGVVVEKAYNDGDIFGRDKEIEEIEKAFKEGNKIVVLSGIGGIGKTKIAEKFAYKMDSEMKNYVQTVHISDILSFDEGDVYNLILSNIKYSKENQSFINTLKNDEKKVKEFQETIIKALPPYSLFIVDNVNKINQDSIKKVIERLNINMVFTSRIEINDIDKVKVIDVLPFDAKELYEEFKKRSKIDDLTLNEFLEIYDATFGHTMTLFTLAKVARMNDYLGKTELLAIKDDLNSIKEKIWVEHNDINKKLTITEQLKALFDTSSLSEKAKSILLELSLINDGTIQKSDLRKYFKLNSYNEINELFENGGWIAIKDDDVSINSFISESMPIIIDESHTLEDFVHVIDYLKNEVDYSNPYLLSDRIFFALYKLMAYTNNSDSELFGLFTKAYIMSYDSSDVLNKVKKLLEKNDSPIIKLLYLSIKFERDNNDLDVINEFLSLLDSSTIIERKVAFKYICRYAYFLNKKDNKRLSEIVVNTTKSIIKSKPINEDREEDTRIRQFMIYILVTLSKDLNIYLPKSIVSDYIRSEKKNPYNTVYLSYLKLFNSGYNALMKSLVDILQIDSSDENKDKAYERIGRKMLFTHPILTIKLYLLSEHLESFKPRTKDEEFAKEVIIYSINLSDHSDIDAYGLFSAAIGYYDFLFENELTLLKQDEFFSNVYNILSAVLYKLGNQNQIDSFKNEIGMLMEDYSSAEISCHQDFSRMLVAERFYSIFGDKKAIETSKKLYDNSISIYSYDSYESLGFLLNYANNLYEFYRYNDAVSQYTQYFNLLIGNGYKAPNMEHTLVKMLISMRFGGCNLALVDRIYSYINDDLTPLNKVYVTYHYLITINRVYGANDILMQDSFKRKLDEFLDIIASLKSRSTEENTICYYMFELMLLVSDDYLIKFIKILKKYRVTFNYKIRKNCNFCIKYFNMAIKASKDRDKYLPILKHSYDLKDISAFCEYIYRLSLECNTPYELINLLTKDDALASEVDKHIGEEVDGVNAMSGIDLVRTIVSRKNGSIDVHYRQAKKEELSFEEFIKKIVNMLLTLKVKKDPIRQQEVSEIRGAASHSFKIARNDPCPCGSGKKYKDCCGQGQF